jgi:hypothetical protein
MALPTYKGSGTFTAGVGAITPPMPTAGAAPAAGDILLLVCESENQAITLSTAAGFIECPGSPQGTGTGGTTGSTRLATFWKRAVGGDTAPTVADSGDHTTGQIHCFAGVKDAPAALASDTFDRADNADLGTNWSVPTGSNACQIVGNDVRAGSLNVDCQEYYDGGITWPDDQYSEVTVVNIGSFGASGPAVRLQTGTLAGYFVECIDANTKLWRNDAAGASTQLASVAAVAAGSVIRLAVVGTGLVVFDDGVPIIAVNDSVGPATGKPGIHCFASQAGSGRLDNWAGGGSIAPWNVTPVGGVDTTSDTSGSIPGTTTTAADCLIVLLCSTSNNATSTTNFSGWSNANLANVTERTDNSNTAGLGGGHGMATGELAAAANYGNTSVTLAASSLKGMMSIALEPSAGSGNVTASPGVGAPVFTGLAAAALLTIRIATGLGAPVLTGFAPTVAVTNNQFVTPGLGQTVFAGQSPAVVVGSAVVVQPGTAAPVLTGLAPTVLVTVKIPIGLGQPVLTGLAPTVAISDNKLVSPGLGQPVFTGLAPSVVAAVTAKPGVGDLQASGLAPSVVLSDNRIATSGLGQVSISGIAPTVLVGTGQAALATPGVGHWTFTGFLPYVEGSLLLAPSLHYAIIAISPAHYASVAIDSLQGTSVMDDYRADNASGTADSTAHTADDAPMGD